MTSLFDAGDLQRLDRERELTEQAPRQLPAENRSPVIEQQDDDDNDFDMMLEGLLMALRNFG